MDVEKNFTPAPHLNGGKAGFKFKCNRFTVLTVCAFATIVPFMGAVLAVFKTNKTEGKALAEEVELEVKSHQSLSHVGEAVFDVLESKHNKSRYETWNIARGYVIGPVQYTPTNVWGNRSDPTESQDYWLPEKMAEIVAHAEKWVDIMTLSPPDGLFLTEFKAAIETLADRSSTADNPIIVRILLGISSRWRAFDCDLLIQSLTNDLPPDANIRIWVGAWRKGLGWNHAKLIAVDGTFLHTGGHNLWHKDYLSTTPVHDLSIESEGSVTVDGHHFANQQWNFMERNFGDCGELCSMSVKGFPQGVTTTFPPTFSAFEVEATTSYSEIASTDVNVSVISVGRLGSIVPKDRPSSDALLAMIDSSQRIVRFVIQDLGPYTIPSTKIVLPGLSWPKAFLVAIGNALYSRGVDIEMVLTNPNPNDWRYWNGWECDDVAAEIIKAIREEYSNIDYEKLRALVTEKLRLTYIRHDGRNNYADGTPIALHSKHIIVDDTAAYIGSENLYSETTDLTEWGVIIDDAEEVQKIKKQYFDLMWKDSYTGVDANLQKALDGIFIHHNDVAEDDNIDDKHLSKLKGAVTEWTEYFKDSTDAANFTKELGKFESMKEAIVELIIASAGESGSIEEIRSIVANWEFATAVEMMSVLTEGVMEYFMDRTEKADFDLTIMLETFATIKEAITELHNTTTTSAVDSDSKEPLQNVTSNWESAVAGYLGLLTDSTKDIIKAGRNFTDELDNGGYFP